MSFGARPGRLPDPDETVLGPGVQQEDRLRQRPPGERQAHSPLGALEERRAELEAQAAEKLAAAEARKAQVEALTDGVTITHKAGEEGRLFGSVGTSDIADACAAVGVEIAKSLYATEMPEGMDAVIANAWPKDTEGTQINMALVPVRGTSRAVVHDEGSWAIAAACPEGLGYHSVMGPGTLFRMRGTRSNAGGPVRRTKGLDMLFSPGMNRYDVRDQYGPQVQFHKTWDELIAALESKHGPAAKVCVLPSGSIQYPLE